MNYTTPKPLTTQKVIAVLKKAGFIKSERHTSGMVRRWATWGRGFRARRYFRDQSKVEVWHSLYGHAITDSDRLQRLQTLAYKSARIGMRVVAGLPNLLEPESCTRTGGTPPGGSPWFTAKKARSIGCATSWIRSGRAASERGHCRASA